MSDETKKPHWTETVKAENEALKARVAELEAGGSTERAYLPFADFYALAYSPLLVAKPSLADAPPYSAFGINIALVTTMVGQYHTYRTLCDLIAREGMDDPENLIQKAQAESVEIQKRVVQKRLQREAEAAAARAEVEADEMAAAS